MYRMETDEEAEHGKARLEKLRKGNLYDRQKAILMDCRIGGFGLWEGIAEEKLNAIIKLCNASHEPRLER